MIAKYTEKFKIKIIKNKNNEIKSNLDYMADVGMTTGECRDIMDKHKMLKKEYDTASPIDKYVFLKINYIGQYGLKALKK